MCITINAIESCIDVPDCMTAVEIKTATLDDEYLSILAELLLLSWPSTKAKVQMELQPNGSCKGQIAIIDGTVIKAE